MKNTYIILQTCTGDYRSKFYNYLLNNVDGLLPVSGTSYHIESVKFKKASDKVFVVKNLFFFNRSFLFQLLPFFKFFTASVVVMEFNLKNFSLYPVFFIRKILGKKTYFWGHAWSRIGKQSKTEFIRKVFKKHSTGYIAYTNSQKRELELQVPNIKAYAACNAIYNMDEMQPTLRNESEIHDFIYVGRLVKDKKPMILVKAFHQIVNSLPEMARLVIVGEGDEKRIISNYIEDHGLTERVILYGHISDYSKLKELYSKSIVSISPGYVGLSITQSLGFGVPMIISKNEPHAPELEAAKINTNAVFFDTDSEDDLASKLETFYNNKSLWISKRDSISKDCRENYSVEKMAQPFINIFR